MKTSRKTIKISAGDLSWAVSEQVISPEQADSLWQGIESRAASRQHFDLLHVIYFFGGLVAISGLGWFITEAWEDLGGFSIFSLAVALGTGFALAGRTLWFRENLKVPGGLLFTMAVCMTPLAIYGIERFTGLWPQGDPGVYRGYHMWVKGSWLIMEAGTIMAGLVALKYVRFPFLTAPIAFSMWYMSMDLTPLLFGKTEFMYEERLFVSLWFGLAMLILAYFMDRRTKDDFSFWLYLFGMMAFWGGLSLMKSDSEINKAIYCAINLCLILLSVFLQRRVFVIFGAMGVFGYIGHLAYRVFEDSLLFPIALSFIGIVIIFLGTKYQRNKEKWERAFLSHVPDSMKQLMPAEREKVPNNSDV